MLDHSRLNTIGGVPVFTLDGAKSAFVRFSARCYLDGSMEAFVALATEADKLHAFGVKWDEIERLEIKSL